MSDGPAIRERIAGSLYGLMCGDALGCPVENMSASQIRAHYGRVDAMREPVKRWRPPGLHSDDGQQAMCLCDAILADPADPCEGFVGQLVALLVEGDTGERAAPYEAFGAHRGTGKNFRETVKRLAAGAGTFEASEPSAGNGNAMLMAPVAWFWRDDPEALIARSVRVGLVKQRDARGVAAGVAVAWLVASALRGELDGGVAGLDGAAWLGAVRDGEERCAEALGHRRDVHTFSEGLEGLLARLDEPRERVLGWIGVNAGASASRVVEATSGYALASVLTSVYMALVSASFEDAVVESVMLGGDADTVGAIVGAIAGAREGFDAIPRGWMESLVAQDAFDDRIDPLEKRTTPWRPDRPLHEMERAWTRLQFRLPGSK